jgi:hypothetical protein
MPFPVREERRSHAVADREARIRMRHHAKTLIEIDQRDRVGLQSAEIFGARSTLVTA